MPLVNRYFSYDLIPEDSRKYLQETAALIHAKIIITNEAIHAIGTLLLEAKRKYPGHFMEWRAYEFPSLSDDTLENYMRVAARIQNIEAIPPTTPVTVLYQITQSKVEEERKEEIVNRLTAGEKIDVKTSYVLANAPAHILTAYNFSVITLGEAYALTKRFYSSGYTEEFKGCIQRWGVISWEVLGWLEEIYRRHQNTNSQTWAQLLEDDGILNGEGWTTHIRDATKNDTLHYMRDRQRLHQLESSEQVDIFRTTGFLLGRSEEGEIIIRLPVNALPDDLEEGQYFKVSIVMKRRTDS